jgi:hypothetical protein
LSSCNPADPSHSLQSESVLIQKLYTHFKKAPATHKLGVLYVVDSVTRKWSEQAKNQGQAVSSSAPDGTFAAGVNRVKELLPSLMNDIIQSAPDDQKVRLEDSKTKTKDHGLAVEVVGRGPPKSSIERSPKGRILSMPCPYFPLTLANSHLPLFEFL